MYFSHFTVYSGSEVIGVCPGVIYQIYRGVSHTSYERLLVQTDE